MSAPGQTDNIHLQLDSATPDGTAPDSAVATGQAGSCSCGCHVNSAEQQPGLDSYGIVIAREAGACYGVERALKMVTDAADSHKHVHTLGPLIHNPRVVSSLAEKGITEISSPDEVAEAATLVIRTHGVAPDIVQSAEDRGLDVLDATCPYVKKVHHSVHVLRDGQYQIIIVGEPGHPEVEAIRGHAGPEALVIDDVEKLAHVKLAKRIGVVAQTTQTHSLLNSVVCRLLETAAEVRIFPTICDATSRRQEAAAELAAKSDAIVVVGGRNSGNTTRLAQICSSACANTHHIEREDELDPCWFEGVSIVGITAGASTPASQIEAVRAAVARIMDGQRHDQVQPQTTETKAVTAATATTEATAGTQRQGQAGE